jgi:CBS domain-containing protein
MNAADIMTQPVITVTPETTIVEAAQLMLQHHISGMPVLDSGGAMVGIITEGDLLRRAETGTATRRAWPAISCAPTPARLARS